MTATTVRVPARYRAVAWCLALLMGSTALLVACAATGSTSASPAPTADHSPSSASTQSAMPSEQGPSSASLSPTEPVDLSPEPPQESLGPTGPAPLPTTRADIDDQVDLTTGMTVSLDAIELVEVTAETPGDTAGPAIAVTVTVMNSSDTIQSVESAVVTLTTAEGDLGIPTIAGGADPLSGEVEAGSTAQGRYVFMLDPAAGRDITVSVNYAAGEPVAEFVGRS